MQEDKALALSLYTWARAIAVEGEPVGIDIDSPWFVHRPQTFFLCILCFLTSFVYTCSSINANQPPLITTL